MRENIKRDRQDQMTNLTILEQDHLLSGLMREERLRNASVIEEGNTVVLDEGNVSINK